MLSKGYNLGYKVIERPPLVQEVVGSNQYVSYELLKYGRNVFPSWRSGCGDVLVSGLKYQ